MTMRRTSRTRTFDFNLVHGVLERTATFPDGHSYTHRCSLDVFQKVAWAIEEAGNRGVTTDELVEATDAPSTQVNVAFEFIKDCGGIHTHGRRTYVACDCLFESVMAEWYYLAAAPNDAMG